MDSPIANLESTATEQSATAGNKNPGAGTVVTGQWLFDEFINKASDDAKTRLALVKKITTQADVRTFDAALKEMRKLAVAADTARYGESSKASPKPAPRTKSAGVRISELRVLYGAFRFAGDAMESLGFADGETGYNSALPLARIALDSKQVKWDGVPYLTSEKKQEQAIIKQQKVGTQAAQELMKEVPQKLGESYLDWQGRIAAMAEERIAQKMSEQESEQVSKAAIDLINKQGAHMARLIADMVLDTLNSTESVEPEPVDAVPNPQTEPVV